jgi:hypothetical protein
MTRIINARRGGILDIDWETADCGTGVLRALRIQLRDSAALPMNAPAGAPPMTFTHPKYAEPSRMWPYPLAGGLGRGPDVYALSDTVLRIALGVELHGKVQLVPRHHRFCEHTLKRTPADDHLT